MFTQREVVRALSPTGRESGNLQRYLDRNPLASESLLAESPVEFEVVLDNGARKGALGREVTVLIEICDKFLEARDKNLLKAAQMPVAVQAEIIMRSCAKVGIIALVDEATGFEKVKKRNDLQLKIQAFIADEIQEWARMFPEEFWFELARLEGVRYSPGSRPLRWGKYVMMFVYDAIDPEIGKELRKRNPNPRFLSNHHQWFKQFGRQRVDVQVQSVLTIMKLCHDMTDFKAKFAHVFKKSPLQMSFNDISIGFGPEHSSTLWDV